MLIMKKRWVVGLVLGLFLVSLPACNMPTTGVACSVPALIKAINAANADVALDILELDPGCTYVLTAADNSDTFIGDNGLPRITTPIIINGNGATISRGSGAPDFRIFFVTNTGILTLNDLTLINGFADSAMDGSFSAFPGSGGAIYNSDGYLEVNGSNVQINQAGFHGGAIFAMGGATFVNSSTINDNIAPRGGGIFLYGGGLLIVDDSEIIYNNASAGGGGISLEHGAELIVTNSVIASNHSGRRGGGIFKDGGADRLPTTITGTTFQGNTADWGGGGVFIWRTPLTISDSAFLENYAGEYGGGLGYQNDSTEIVEIINTTFDGNTSLLDGGGIHFSGELMTIEGSTFQNNTAENGSGIYNGATTLSHYITRPDTTMVIQNSALQGNTANADGGGVFNDGVLTVEESTFSENMAFTLGGGLHNTGDLLIQDSTFDGNAAGFDGGGVCTYSDTTITGSTFVGNTATRGGGLASVGGDTLLLNNTFSANTASDSGGGIFNMGPTMGDAASGGGLLANHITVAQNSAANGGGLATSGGLLEIKNSLVAYSVSGADCYSGGVDFSAVGENLDKDGSCAGFTLTDDPLLHSLADNGGPTHTHALKGGSPAIDAAPDCTTIGGAAVPVDQRGQPRPGGPHCDLGAYEDEAGGPGEPPDIPVVTIPPFQFDTPEVLALQNATCRFGPGRIFHEVDYLLEGQTAAVEARNEDSTWLQIVGPKWGKLCWVWVDLLDVKGDIDPVAVKTPPATPTPTPTSTPTPTPKPRGCWWRPPNANVAECKVPCPNDQYSGDACNP